MPFVHLRAAGTPLSSAQAQALKHALTELMEKVLHKNPQLTSVLVEQTPIEGWGIGGGAVPRAAHLDVKITFGTNKAEEKARFLTRAHALMTEILGILPDVTCVVVREVAADAWGYGGETQAQRSLRAKAA